MTLSQQEVEDLKKWIEYHLKGYENDQNPQLLAGYIKSLILRQASQQRMVAVLRDFMDEKAEDFVSLLEKHLKTKDFSIPEEKTKEKLQTPAPKKQETAFKIVIEEVKPESLVARPVITEKPSTSHKKKTTSSKKERDIVTKADSNIGKDTWKSHDKNPSKSKYSSSSQFEKKENYSKSFSDKSKEKDKKSSRRDTKSKEKISYREKESKSLRSKDKYTKKSRSRRSPSPYSSDDYYDYTDYDKDDYNDYDDYDDYEDDYNYEYDYYSYDSYQYDDKKPKRRPPPMPKFEKRPPILKKQRFQKKFKDFTPNQKNNRNDSSIPNTIKRQTSNEDSQNNKNIREPSEVERDHIFIIAVCGIPSKFNTVGHILKEFNRFGLIYGIQIITDQKMALIEFGDLESAYRAVNSRHRFFHNNTIKVDYAVQISQDMLDPIEEKIKQKKLIVENKKKEKLLKKQRALEARTNALAQAAAMAAAAINNINNNDEADLSLNANNDSDREFEENEQLLLKTLSEKIDEYEQLEDCERKEKLRKDIEELSSFLEYIS